MRNLPTFIEDTRNTLLPPGRAKAVATSLEQVTALLPEDEDFTLADLAIGWGACAISQEEENTLPNGPEKSRAVTCRELAEIASRDMYTTGEAPGRKDYAIRAWEIWANALAASSDDREKQMSRTFHRELVMIEG